MPAVLRDDPPRQMLVRQRCRYLPCGDIPVGVRLFRMTLDPHKVKTPSGVESQLCLKFVPQICVALIAFLRFTPRVVTSFVTFGPQRLQ